jgi:hypothetical protein
LSNHSWFLLQTKGPRNAAIDPNQLAQIHTAFAAAGIPEAAIIDPIKSIIQTMLRHACG